MEIRDLDYSKDIEEVVALIRENLQPEYTEEFLRWKHLKNPFGPSFSLVATYREQIVGVLFYMRYNFYNHRGEMVKCIRPFDACTAPQMRGKGIFKKLMTKGLDKYKNDYQFLLANPNSNSFPEFLKLGWKEPKHNYSYQFGVIIPSKIRKGEILTDISQSANSSGMLFSPDFFQVGNSLKFLHWRYQDPVYVKLKFASADNKILYIVYRRDRIKGLPTVVLCDMYGDTSILQKAIKRILGKEKTIFIYFLENPLTKELKPLFSLKHKKALIVFKGNNFRIPANLVVSLGDLEGKL